jgi:uncharacterized protein
MAVHAVHLKRARFTRWTLTICIVALTIGIAFAISAITPLLGERKTALGSSRNTALAITMRDGTPIAVDVWLPSTIKPNERIPTLIKTTRYWRATRPGPVGRLMMHFGVGMSAIEPDVEFFNAHGYAIILVDARGTGASSGVRRVEWSPEEAADSTQILDWIVRQPWSNGRVGAFGTSYDANTAEMLAGQGHPALRAVVSISSDFDAWAGNVRPGGVYNRFADQWGKAVAALDANDICAVQNIDGIKCWLNKWVVQGVKPVDTDGEGLALKRIVERRAVTDVAQTVRKLEFRDGQIAPGVSWAETNPYGLIEKPGYRRVPMQIWTGWFDAMTSDGAVARFINVPSAQEIWIGPWSHGVRQDADPFKVQNAPITPDLSAMHTQMLRFFDNMLGNQPAPKRSLGLYLMGVGRWTSIEDWEKETGRDKLELFAGVDRSLSKARPSGSGTVAHDIDFSASTGGQTRWHTQDGGGDIIYANQAEQDKKRLVFRSDPLPAHTNVVGAPVLDLAIKSSSPTGAVHIYLEAEAPDGRVIYLSEGLLRLDLRRDGAASAGRIAYRAPNPVRRSFARADALPMPTGEFVTIAIPLAIVGAQIPAGYRVRVAIAGADASLFQRYPAQGRAGWTIATGEKDGTKLMLPILPSPNFISPPWDKNNAGKD